MDLVASCVAACRTSSPSLEALDETDVLFRTGVTVTGTDPGSTRSLSVAGLLALGVYPQQHLPNCVIQASPAPRGNDPAGTRAADVRRFDGPVPTMLDEALRWVRRSTRTRVRFGPDGQGRDEPEFPAEAVRELLSNALIHRDLGPYALTTAVTLEIDARQLLLSNPGGLAEGIPKVLAASREAAMALPQFEDQGIRFSVRVPNHSLLAPEDLRWASGVASRALLSDQQRQALIAMRHGTRWTDKSFRDMFPMDSREAQRALAAFVNPGRAARGGSGTRTENTAVVREKLAGRPSSVGELTGATGLRASQVSYALRILRGAGEVTLEGGRGRSDSRYGLAADQTLGDQENFEG